MTCAAGELHGAGAQVLERQSAGHLVFEWARCRVRARRSRDARRRRARRPRRRGARQGAGRASTSFSPPLAISCLLVRIEIARADQDDVRTSQAAAQAAVPVAGGARDAPCRRDRARRWRSADSNRHARRTTPRRHRDGVRATTGMVARPAAQRPMAAMSGAPLASEPRSASANACRSPRAAASCSSHAVLGSGGCGVLTNVVSRPKRRASARRASARRPCRADCDRRRGRGRR